MRLNPEGKNILITGVAGFIGSNLAKRLLGEYKETKIVGIDNMNAYYDVSLKEKRLRETEALGKERFQFRRVNIADKEKVWNIFREFSPDIVVNLAAQAGVRYSITNPDAYIESNLLGFYNILEACRHSRDGEQAGVSHLVFASSSSVYGGNRKIPYSTEDRTDEPVSLYAATKKANELMARSYSKLYGIPSTGIRFFTVYGPAGRPDMAYFKFAEKMKNGEKIQLYNFGDMYRDFTYIDDAVTGLILAMENPPASDGEKVPPQTDGEKVPPQTVGEEVPPQTVGEKVPPQTVGEKIPSQTDGEEVLPQTDGEEVLPQTVGEKVPPQTDGEKVPPQTVGEEVPPQTYGEEVPCRIYNIGSQNPHSLAEFVDLLEQYMREAGLLRYGVEIELLPMQPGDVYRTYADMDNFIRDFNFAPRTDLKEGLSSFVKWYRSYCGGSGQ